MITVYSHKGIKPYTGFIYLWKDTKSNRYYLGSHMGHKDDGYKGSGIYFQRAFKKDPKSFKRRIIQYVLGDIALLKTIEEKWLSQIEESDLGSKYYNLSKIATGLVQLSYSSRSKISEKKRGKSFHTAEWKLEHSKRMLGNKLRVGTSLSDEHKDAIRKASKPHTEESKEKIRKANLGKVYDADLRKKCGNKKSGKKCYNDGTQSKFYFSDEQPAGWVLGRL